MKKQTTKAEKTNVRTTKVLYLSDVLLIYKVRLKQCNEGENFASCEEEISSHLHKSCYSHPNLDSKYKMAKIMAVLGIMRHYETSVYKVTLEV